MYALDRSAILTCAWKRKVVNVNAQHNKSFLLLSIQISTFQLQIKLSRKVIPKILKIWLYINFPPQISILFLVLSSIHDAGTAWPVRVSANESCITPLHLLRVKCMYLVLERNINLSYINESNSKYLRLSHPPTIQMVRPNQMCFNIRKNGHRIIFVHRRLLLFKFLI